ncbi:hypothetical protein [Bradyrhizobium sp. LMTR 3]|nr:hypothetical protein [Bradyrhizobium sp. LMTR 3]
MTMMIVPETSGSILISGLKQLADSAQGSSGQAGKRLVVATVC